MSMCPCPRILSHMLSLTSLFVRIVVMLMMELGKQEVRLTVTFSLHLIFIFLLLLLSFMIFLAIVRNSLLLGPITFITRLSVYLIFLTSESKTFILEAYHRKPI